MGFQCSAQDFPVLQLVSKKSPTGPTERTPQPEYLIALATYLYRGPLVRSHSILMDCMFSSSRFMCLLEDIQIESTFMLFESTRCVALLHF